MKKQAAQSAPCVSGGSLTVVDVVLIYISSLNSVQKDDCSGIVKGELNFQLHYPLLFSVWYLHSSTRKSD